jgi:hypothetical protein
VTVSFIGFRQFNDPALRPHAGIRRRVAGWASQLFPADTMLDKLARALIDRRTLPLKEIVEAVEFFQRVRRRLRAPIVADLCCGHGLAGMLFAVFEPRVERAILIDRQKPDSHERVRQAVEAVAPWVSEKVVYWEGRIEELGGDLAPNTSIVAVHACGGRTDRCLGTATRLGGNLAVMPCCHAKAASRAPRALLDSLGVALATDIDRTYRLERDGYQVAWSAIPAVVTAMHRILVGVT